jgi:hypothetical protein
MKRNTKGSVEGPRWKLDACSLGAFKTYDNLWEGENKKFPAQ